MPTTPNTMTHPRPTGRTRLLLTGFGWFARRKERKEIEMKKKAKKTPATAEELAQAVREETMEFDDALLEYLSEYHSDRLEDTSFFIVMSITIGYAAMGQWEKLIPLSGDEKMTVKEVI